MCGNSEMSVNMFRNINGFVPTVEREMTPICHTLMADAEKPEDMLLYRKNNRFFLNLVCKNSN